MWEDAHSVARFLGKSQMRLNEDGDYRFRMEIGKELGVFDWNC